MTTYEKIYLAALAFIGLSVPLATYSGYYVPACADALVWTLSGYHQQLVCF